MPDGIAPQGAAPSRRAGGVFTRSELACWVSGSFLLALPLKALADYVYVHRLDWASARPVIESLRVEETALAAVDASSFDQLLGCYRSQRVRRFLEGLQKDLIR